MAISATTLRTPRQSKPSMVKRFMSQTFLGCARRYARCRGHDPPYTVDARSESSRLLSYHLILGYPASTTLSNPTGYGARVELRHLLVGVAMVALDWRVHVPKHVAELPARLAPPALAAAPIRSLMGSGSRRQWPSRHVDPGHARDTPSAAGATVPL